jgi:hypothetical protein
MKGLVSVGFVLDLELVVKMSKMSVILGRRLGDWTNLKGR